MIILVSLSGGVLSVLCAAFLALKAKAAWVPMLISYAIGALLGAVFLEILPHAFEVSSSPEVMSATILAGILLFFILEKLVLWRHCHGEECEVHAGDTHHTHKHAGHDHGRSGLMIMIGDTFHNFVDGVLIAAAFLADVHLGMVTAIAIIAHEIPQEVGDFLILLHSGYNKRQALLFNLFSSMATLIGGVGAYFALGQLQAWIPTILGLAAASMIYVAVADLIPGLHKRTELRATLQQAGLISLGVISIWLAGELVH
ncbi:zinc and cadmium transporter [Methylobacillus rhizosphaerae]|uniref:Zinc and cadmium transporter n=2 Tax=Methylobacillus rhizosphaerae TaxID=551994 RepID=A0A238ZS58_9PROT|nr:zinc and cadmium transporter [Methylobacillus rhizosphaerae]